jgi:hypothetical protein
MTKALFFMMLVTSLCGCVSQSTRKGFVLQEDFSGSEFFKHFIYDAIPDPTDGYVSYVDDSAATHYRPSPLTSVNFAGHAIIATDSTNIAAGSGRVAIRLKSKSSFTTGLFITDVVHMPEGLGTRPAYWSFGPNWPNSGEIDLIEGVNNQSVNSISLHTNSGCKMPLLPLGAMIGKLTGNLDCSTDTGCTSTSAVNTFGPNFNRAGGGVFALLWKHNSIQVWIWPRNSVPADVLSLQPNPSHWGIPNTHFTLGEACTAKHFVDHQLVLNTTFCGRWASAEFPEGANACKAYVRDHPSAFVNAYWEIASLRVYRIP